MQTHIEIVQLIVAYTLTGAFVFTVIATCLSLVGWIEFKFAEQQKKLFSVLIVELVVVCVGFFAGFLKFDASSVQEAVISDYINAPGLSAVGSNFEKSNFSKSKFSQGMFNQTLFDMTAFRDTVFVKSDFRGAEFQGANFKGVDLSKIVIDENTILPETDNKPIKPTSKASAD